MITLNEIKKSILNDDKGLELLLFEYFNQKISNDSNNIKQVFERKDELKKEIEESIIANDLENAKVLLNEYRNIVGNDLSVYSIAGIIEINENNLEKAFEIFSQGLAIDNSNVDLLYNMAQLATIIGEIDSSIYYYNECLKYTNDKSLIEDIESGLKSLYSVPCNNKNTIISLDLEELECSLFSQKHNLINIIENINIENEKKYEYDEYIQYEVNSTKLMNKIESLIKYNENCILLVKNDYEKNLINKFYGEIKLAYYINENNYTNEMNYFRNSINLFNEKNICNNIDYIITNNIILYNYKKIVECRDNVFFINEKFEFEDKLKMNNYFKMQLENTDNKYDKLCYLLALEDKNSEKYIELSKYAYEKYDNKEFYYIYISLLNRNKKYKELINVTTNSKYCDDVFKSEILYLYNKNEKELVSFIVNLSIKNYKLADDYLNNINEKYKLAAYNFEIENRDEAFKIYIDLNKETKKFDNSPMINRNMYHLLYLKGNKDYKKYEDKYNIIINNMLNTIE